MGERFPSKPDLNDQTGRSLPHASRHFKARKIRKKLNERHNENKRNKREKYHVEVTPELVKKR